MKPLSARALRAALLALILVGAPLLGLVIADRPIAPYLEFPPRTRYVDHAPFSWTVFTLIALLILACTWPLALLPAGRRRSSPAVRSGAAFPWWGWSGVALTATSWMLAWNRWDWFTPLQPHTFTPLWLGFILVVNALICGRRGTCPMLVRPGRFALLFPVSAVFWWFFEYLNRFVQNWYYTGVDYPPVTYFLLATPAFATVLPAVLSVREWLLSFPAFQVRRRPVTAPAWLPPRTTAVALLTAATAGLAGVGRWPDYLFPLLWTAPLVILLTLQAMSGRSPLLDDLRDGRWPHVAAAALAGLVCGFFWEMWNYYSLARWTYSVPWVDRFHLFEMPLLGYAGYLPFGLECALIADAVWQPLRLSPGPAVGYNI
jgi:hypothetical protein